MKLSAWLTAKASVIRSVVIKGGNTDIFMHKELRSPV